MPATLFDLPKDAAPSQAGLPLLKWVGGKARLLPAITGEYTGQRHIVEPFFGGGALSFHLAARTAGLTVNANDRISELIDIYQAVRADPQAFIDAVNVYALPYLACEGKTARRTFYYDVRQRYMERTIDGPAPLFFMLWCAYSGLYRTGKTFPGRFNTPHGFGKEKADFFHAARLRWAGPVMANWTFTSGDFFDTLETVTADSFVFLDPPYRTTYDNYTKEGFSDDDHERVVEYFKAAHARGAKVVYTNKYTDDGFYEDRFADFTIRKIPIKYQVNADCATVGRPTTFEAFITT